jgi:predicted dehydrogenase
MKKLNVGIIGCGKVSREAHIPSYISMENVQIKALCDADEAKAKEINSKYRLKAAYYRDYLDLLEKEEVDFVDICTPGFTHYQICKDAIKHGIDVITEKPPALSLNQFLELKKLSEKKDVKVGVMMNYRYKDIILKLKNCVDHGELGEIKKIQSIHHGPTVFNDSEWLWEETKSFYLLYEFGIHFMDLQVDLCGEHDKVLFVNPIYVKELDSTTDIQMVIKFKNGALGLVDLTADSTLHSSFFSWMNVYGTGSDAFIRFFPPLIKMVSGVHNPINNLWNEIRTNVFIANKLLRNKFQEYRNESHKRVLELFVNSICSSGQSPISIDDFTNTMKLLEEIKQKVPSYQIDFKEKGNH